MSEKRKVSDLVLVSLKVPKAMLDEIDRVVREKGYMSRSDFIRQVVRRYLSEEGKE